MLTIYHHRMLRLRVSGANLYSLYGKNRDSCNFDLLNGGFVHGKVCTYTRQHKQRSADKHVPSEIQTNDPTI
jgi:hypothetical protein